MKLVDKKITALLYAALITVVVFAITAHAKSSNAVKIPTHNWNSQLVGAEIIGELFKKVGEDVEYIPVDGQTVYQAMCEGDIDIVHEVWEGAFGKSFQKQVDKGCVVDLVTHEAKTREDWWYPEYIEEVCPGLPDWKALNRCSHMFVRADSGGKGVFIGGPVGWLKHDAEKVEALDMDFVVKNAGSAGAIWAELDAAVANKKPIVIFNWSPNFIGAKYKGKFVEFPEYEPECTEDASWGLNKEMKYDCGNTATGYLKIGVNKDFAKNHPKAYAVTKKINFSGEDINLMANYVDTNKLEIREAAQKWLRDHKDKWSEWVK